MRIMTKIINITKMIKVTKMTKIIVDDNINKDVFMNHIIDD